MHGLPLRSLSVVLFFISTAIATADYSIASALPGDSVREARCIAKCYHQPAPEQPKCYSGCWNEPWIKPGGCPVADLDDVSLDRPCLEQCDADDFCQGVYKCCRHSCGITCQPPVGLSDYPGLPDEPTIVAVSDYGKTLQVEWTLMNRGNHHVTYLLQERHHVGVKYVPERMTPWVTVARTDKTREVLKKIPTAGRWFQFRLAAVNENGTRGYSKPCRPFFVNPDIDPPGPPENLKVTSLKWTDKGYQQCVLSWTPPVKAMLPVRKYKVFISEQDGSHLYHKRHVLPADTLRFPIRKLNANSEYFLQVQAISEFGRKRLAGQKASVTLKTEGKKLSKNTKKLNGLKIVKFINSTGGDTFNVRISWRPVGVNMISNQTVYTFSCIPDNCPLDSKAFNTKTRLAYFDMFSLNGLCKYLIVVTTGYNGSKYMASLKIGILT
ncbi:anosmin-1 isoform X2 [Adelges cooleyi]|uniref:anosmin-1 isoform X2 n=1 Tax=Adelges cooleyi TaxID=133065 RepID=UPI00217FA6D6|nr:anosmin-1 isoform X2 [Adelges cooleyi]